MPTYITRNIQEYHTEFYRCPANPEGFEFQCMFSCGNFFKTKSACISHMKKCCSDEDMEYGNDIEVSEGVSVYDMHRNQAAKSTTVKNYILTNQLESLSNLTPNEIKERIQRKLIENGFSTEAFYMNTEVFLIYKFFFEVSDDENTEFKNYCSEQLCSRIFV
jgi:hypothetical protein